MTCTMILGILGIQATSLIQMDQLTPGLLGETKLPQICWSFMEKKCLFLRATDGLSGAIIAITGNRIELITAEK